MTPNTRHRRKIVFAQIVADRLGPDQPLPASPDTVWREAPSDGPRSAVTTPTDGVRIRDATLGDAEVVGELITELGYPTVTAGMVDRLRPILGDPSYTTVVADVDGKVVGVAGATINWYYEKDGIYSRLVVLAVSSTARGQGIGSELVAAVEKWSASNGAREVFVNSGLHRDEAHIFYERLGYSRTGYRFVKRLISTG